MSSAPVPAPQPQIPGDHPSVPRVSFLSRLLMTDWAVDEKVLPEGNSSLEIYLTHPLSARTYNAKKYRVFGEDARTVVSQLIQDSDDRFVQLASNKGGTGYFLRRIMGIRRVRDARRALAQEMEASVLQHRTFNLVDGPTSFGANGIRTDASFHIWRVKNTKEGFTAAE